MSTSPASFITPAEFLAHWQGHRRLTRRVIEAFPDNQLFTFSIGGMRSFGTLALEMLAIAVPTLRGVTTGDWTTSFEHPEVSKAELLRQWDESTAQIDEIFPRIALETFHEHMVAFGQWPGLVWDLLYYAHDNEIHHRGQGFVYLRALGVEPPQFFER